MCRRSTEKETPFGPFRFTSAVCTFGLCLLHKAHTPSLRRRRSTAKDDSESWHFISQFSVHHLFNQFRDYAFLRGEAR
nr:hypothetical protein Iba_chr09dCG1940 [Ipomoea batatas]